MAGFFSLGGGGGGGGGSGSTSNNPDDPNYIPQNPTLPHHHHHQNAQENSFFVYTTSSSSYNRGFELWQQPPPPPHHHQNPISQNHPLLQLQDLYSVAAGPSRRRTSTVGGINFSDEAASWRSEQLEEDDQAAALVAMSSSSSGYSGAAITSCQDCGNQAKKGCVHMRCRTCCKSRGFHCQTHVKSTWVPAAKRRQRQDQQQIASNLQSPPPPPQVRRQIPKTHREENSSTAKNHQSVAPASLISNSSSRLEVGNFPAEVNSPALFRCVKVSAVDDREDQYAYQTAVTIGGHLFKGMLYDQGPETQYMAAGDTSSGGSAGMSQLNLSGSSPGTTTAAAAASLDHSPYPQPPLNAFMAGTQFFYQPPRT